MMKSDFSRKSYTVDYYSITAMNNYLHSISTINWLGEIILTSRATDPAQNSKLLFSIELNTNEDTVLCTKTRTQQPTIDN